MKTSEQVNEILEAVMKVKAKLQAVTKSSNNPFFKSKYADLNTHLEAVEPLLEENGLMLLQPVTINALGVNVVSSTIINKNGQFVSSEMTVVTKEQDMQKLGSAITYARRYTLGSLLSMKAEDDDGNNASDKTSNKVTAKSDIQITLGSSTQGGGTTTEAVVQAAPKDKPSFRNYKKKTEAPKVEEVKTSGDDL